MAIVAIFMGIYYIGSEYQITIGFCAIALGIIILIALETGNRVTVCIPLGNHDKCCCSLYSSVP